MGPADLDALLELCVAHAEYERAAYVHDGQPARLARALFGAPRRLWCLVVECESHLVGYATYTLEYSTWRAAEYVHVDCLFVSAEVRGRGLGRELMARIASHAGALGARQLEWQTPEWNQDAQRFYERLGAQPVTKRRYSWRPVG